MQSCASSLQEKNTEMRHYHFAHLHGLEATDALVKVLLTETGFFGPPLTVSRWRRRLQDAMLDSHFSLGQSRFLVAAEPDQLSGLSQTLHDSGGRVTVANSTVDSTQMENNQAEQ